MDFSPSFLVQVDDALCDCVGELKQHTDRFETMRTSSLDFDGFVSALGLALRSELPLRVHVRWNDEVSNLRVLPPPSREMRLSTWSVPRSFPSVGTRGHGIVQHRRRRTLTSALQAVSLSRIFYVVSLSWLLYASVFVDRLRLPTFLDPPWLLMSNHPSLFDRQVVLPEGTLVDLQSSDSGISAFKNCFFGGSLPSILLSLSPWQSSVLYYDCSCAHVLVHFLFGSVVPTFDVPAGTSSRLVWEKMVMFMGGSRMRGLLLRIWPFGEMSWGEKVILFWIKRCLESCLVPLARMGGARSRALS